MLLVSDGLAQLRRAGPGPGPRPDPTAAAAEPAIDFCDGGRDATDPPTLMLVQALYAISGVRYSHAGSTLLSCWFYATLTLVLRYSHAGSGALRDCWGASVNPKP